MSTFGPLVRSVNSVRAMPVSKAWGSVIRITEDWQRFEAIHYAEAPSLTSALDTIYTITILHTRRLPGSLSTTGARSVIEYINIYIHKWRMNT